MTLIVQLCPEHDVRHAGSSAGSLYLIIIIIIIITSASQFSYSASILL